MWWGATFTSLAWCGEKVCLENLDQCCSKASKLVYVPPGIVPLNSETLQEWWFHSPSRPLCQCCIPLIREKNFCVSSCDFPWYNLWLMAFVFSLLAARWVWLHPCSNPAPSASPYVPSAPPPAVIVAFYCTHCQYLVLWASKLDTSSQMWPHEGWIEGNNHFPWSESWPT